MKPILPQHYFFRFLFLLAPFVSASAMAENIADPDVKIAVLNDIHNDYRLFLGNRNPLDIDYYGGNHARRDVIELVLMQQALAQGGFTRPLTFVNDENYFRSIRNVMDGKTLTISGTVWYQDLLPQIEKLHISPPIVEDGQFIVGFYTSPSNKRARSSRTREEISKLRAVTSRQWKPDLDTLEKLGFTQIMHTPNWINMARMIKAGRVDVTLSPIESTPSMEIIVEDIRLVPIDGVKVAIKGSRHWPVSKLHPQGDEFYQALVIGVEKLRKEGRIEKAYRECGFFHPELAGWKLLNTIER